CHQYRSDPLTF
nr:immunoglobulin light chain junction region [Macaca mulatta]